MRWLLLLLLLPCNSYPLPLEDTGSWFVSRIVESLPGIMLFPPVLVHTSPLPTVDSRLLWIYIPTWCSCLLFLPVHICLLATFSRFLFSVSLSHIHISRIISHILIPM